MLGRMLGVEPDQLHAIRSSTVSVQEKKAEMLRMWLQSSQGASWQDVVTALQRIREIRLATTIKQKYLGSLGKCPVYYYPVILLCDLKLLY